MVLSVLVSISVPTSDPTQQACSMIYFCEKYNLISIHNVNSLSTLFAFSTSFASLFSFREFVGWLE